MGNPMIFFEDCVAKFVWG